LGYKLPVVSKSIRSSLPIFFFYSKLVFRIHPPAKKYFEELARGMSVIDAENVDKDNILNVGVAAFQKLTAPMFVFGYENEKRSECKFFKLDYAIKADDSDDELEEVPTAP
jgi:hypothetical protein